MAGSPAFELRGVTVRFDQVAALDALDLRIGNGDKVVIRGRSGSGKSTLLRLLLGFVHPDEGEVRFRGEVLRPDIADRVRAEVSYVNQDPDLPRGTIEDALLRPCRFGGRRELPDRRARTRALEQFRLPGTLLDREISELSGGEKQRVVLASSLLQEREILLLDEPTSALDEELTARCANSFLSLDPDRTVIAVSHDDGWNRPDLARIVDLSVPARP